MIYYQKLYKAYFYLLVIIYVEKYVIVGITLDEKFKATSMPFFIPDFNLLSCELDNFTFKLLYSVILN